MKRLVLIALTASLLAVLAFPVTSQAATTQGHAAHKHVVHKVLRVFNGTTFSVAASIDVSWSCANDDCSLWLVCASAGAESTPVGASIRLTGGVNGSPFRPVSGYNAVATPSLCDVMLFLSTVDVQASATASWGGGTTLADNSVGFIGRVGSA